MIFSQKGNLITFGVHYHWDETFKKTRAGFEGGGGVVLNTLESGKPVWLEDNMKLDIHNHILPSTWPNFKEVRLSI